jgi:hypothetical protein
MNERGSVTFWLLGLAFAVCSLGVLSVDLWALIGERRELAARVDAAATAAVTAIDEGEWRASGRLVLDRPLAEERARAVVGSDARDVVTVEFGVDGVTVRVSVSRNVATALLGLAGSDHVTVGAAAEGVATVRD